MASADAPAALAKELQEYLDVATEKQAKAKRPAPNTDEDKELLQKLGEQGYSEAFSVAHVQGQCQGF